MKAVPYRERLIPLLIVLAVVSLPAIGLRAACLGNSCGDPAVSAARVPFCSLPPGLRSDIANGYREKRSPDVLVVPREPAFAGWASRGQRGVRPLWPSTEEPPPQQVPLVFSGAGIRPDAPIPDGATLDRVAPTLIDLLGIEWNNPAVHPGAPLPVTSSGDVPKLVLVLALEGVGSEDLLKGPGDCEAFVQRCRQLRFWKRK